MPRRIRQWLDPFAALQELRAFVAARTRAAGTALASWLGRATRATRSARRPARTERDPRLEKAALELRPMDWRNPPSDTITGVALPLAATAAAAAAAAYFVASWQSQERTGAPAAERVGAGAFDAAPPGVAAVTLGGPVGGGGARVEDPFGPPLAVAAPGSAAALDAGAAGAVDGAGSTLRAAPEDESARRDGGGGGGGFVDARFTSEGGGSGNGGGGSGGPGDGSFGSGTAGVGGPASGAANRAGAGGGVPAPGGTDVLPLSGGGAGATGATGATGHAPATAPVPLAAPPGTGTGPAAPASGASSPFVLTARGGRPLPTPVIFAGSGAAPVVRQYDAQTGHLNFEAAAFDPALAPGGVVVAAGDFNRDGYPDVVVAPAGAGSPPRVRVLDGRTGGPLAGPLGGFPAFDPGATSVSIAAADVNGDSVPDVVAAAVTPAGAEVRVFDGRTAVLVAEFAVPGADFARGLSVAAADFTGAGRAQVAVGAGPGGDSLVRVYDPLTGETVPGPLGSFRAFDAGTPGGAVVATDALAGDVDGDGHPDLAVGTGPGAVPRVRVFSGKTGAVLLDLVPFDAGATGGVHVGLAYVTDDRFADAVVGSGPGVAATVRVFDGRTGRQLPGATGEYHPFGGASGVSVAASNDPFITSFTATPSSQTVPLGSAASVTAWAALSGASARLDFSAAWGDGSTDTYTAALPGPGSLSSPFGHTYAAAGTYTVTLTLDAYDAAAPPVYQGTGTTTAAITVTVPTVTGVSPGTGSAGAGYLTNSATPTASGAATAGSTVTVYRQGATDPAPVAVGTTTASGAGLWTYALPTVSPDGAYRVTVTAATGGVTSLPSAPLTVTLDTTAPAVTVAVVGPTYDRRPPVTVTAADRYGISGSATVALDVDRNNDGNFTDAGETDFATGTLVNGALTFDAYPTLLTVGVTAQIRARVLDRAGNQGTSSARPVAVTAAPTTWVATTATAQARAGYGAPAGAAPAAALVYAGDVTASHPLDLDASPAACGCQTPSLVYNSQEAAPAPVVQATVQSDNALGVPTQVVGTLTWDGAVAGTATYDLSTLSPGGAWVFGLAPTAGLSTGRHAYALALFIDYPGTVNDQTRTVTGATFLVNRSGGPYGAGWSFSDVDALLSVASDGTNPAGVLREFGAGGWSFYTTSGGGYTSPAGDAGTLAAAGGGWTYTDRDGKVRTFNASGQQTKWASADGASAVSYTYDASGGVANVLSPDGGVGTFVYASGLLSTATAPGSRVTTVTYSGTDPTTIADPAAGTHTFAYAAHRVTGQTQRGGAAAYTYTTGGLAQTTKLGTDPVGTVTAALAAGVGTAATAGIGGSIKGGFTDGRGNNGLTWFNAFGQPVQIQAADGGIASYTRNGSGYVTGSTDPLGRATGYTVDGSGRVTQITRPDATAAAYAYGGANGALTRYTDYLGGVWTVTNDAYGRPVTTTDPLGRVGTLAYSSGLLQTSTDALGNVTTRVYDASRRVIGTLVGGAPTGTVGYDAAGNPVTVTDALGNVTTRAFDGAGRPTAVTDALNATATTTYDALGRVLSMTDARGNVTSFGYDAAGRPTAVIGAFGTGLARTTTSAYDGVGNVVATTDGLGNTTTSVYDAQNRQIATVDPLGNRTSAQYDLAGQVLATIDPLGRVTQYGYDALGRQIATTDALGNVSSTVYDADSRAIATADPLGHRSSSVFDAAGQMVARVDALGNRTSRGYDAAGRPVTTTDALGNVTSAVYDTRNRQIARVDALGNRTSSGYDAADNRVTTTDPNGNVTTGAFDALNRQIATVDALGNRTSRAFDAAGNRTAAVDALGNRTTGAFDALNRQIATVDALGNRSTGVFDAADRMIATIDALGHRGTTIYDAANRAVAREDALRNSTTRAFDAAGNVVATTDALGRTTSYAVDGLNRVVATTDALGAVTSASYDAAGRQVTRTDPLGNVTTSVYDDADRMVATVDALGNRSTSVYDAAGNATAGVDALGRRTTGVFDALNRQIATVDALGNRSTSVFDAAGNRTASVDALGRRTTSVFDALNRPVATVDALGNRATSAFDAAGNAVAAIDPLGNRSTSVYDALNRAQATVDALGNRSTVTFDAVGNVRTTIDALNRTTTSGYDARNMRVATTDALGNVWTAVYDALGRAVASIDPLGRRATTVFDAAGQSVARVDALGNRATTVYDLAGNAVATIDPLGHRSTSVYDALNRVQATVDALGNRATGVYDAAGNVTVAIDALNRRSTSAFDALNRVVATTDALGGVGTVAYDAAGNVTAHTDPLNHTTSYGYDVLNRAVTTTNALGQVGTTAYDAVGNTVSYTDALNHTTTSVYDALNRAVATVDPLGNRGTSVFDAAGQVTAAVDPLGNRTSYTYDLRGLVRTVTDPLGNVTTAAYDAAGNAVAATNARGYTTTSTFDALNRAVAVTDALGNSTTSVFDAAGNRTATIDALGYRATAVYDELNRSVAMVDPFGDRSTTTYDAVGNVATSTDALNQTTSYGYDALNRPVTTIDPRGFVTTSVFDAAGNRTVLVDASANRTTSAYDALDRVITQTDPFAATTTTAYDAAGRQTSQTDALGRRRDFAFDDSGRVLTEKWYAAGGALTQTQTWTYDTAGRMLTAQDPDGAYTLAYDAAGRVTAAQEPFGLVLTMGYDAAGNRTSVTDSKSGVTTVTFDALNRQTSEQTAGSGVSAMRFDTAYTARGEVASRTRYSNLAGSAVVGTTTYDYDAAGHETHQKQTNGSGTVLANYTYTYDAAARMTAKQEDGTTTSYSYDTTDQLTADGATTYGYDGTGNRTNTGYATGAGNRLTSDGLWTWTYDAAGNATKRSKGASSDTWVYGYDNRNQMVSAAYSATDGGAVTQRVTYVYDAFGNRIERDAWDGTTTAVERYGVDGWDPAKPRPVGTENFDTWVDLDNTNALTMRRMFGFSFDELIARQTAGGTVLYYLTDYQGSVRQLVDNSGTVVGTLAYSAFGQVTASSGTADRYRYTSREADAATGLQFSRGRVYDSVSGKWLSADSMGFAAGDVNLYRYAGNGVTTRKDPSGLDYITATSEAGADAIIASMAQYGIVVEKVDNGTGNYELRPTGNDIAATIDKVFAGFGNIPADEANQYLRHVLAALRPGGPNFTFSGVGNEFSGKFSKIEFKPLLLLSGPIGSSAIKNGTALLVDGKQYQFYVPGRLTFDQKLAKMSAVPPDSFWDKQVANPPVQKFVKESDIGQFTTGVVTSLFVAPLVAVDKFIMYPDHAPMLAWTLATDSEKRLEWAKAALKVVNPPLDKITPTQLGEVTTGMFMTLMLLGKVPSTFPFMGMCEDAVSVAGAAGKVAPASQGLSPANFGLSAIIQHAALHRMWTDAMRSAANATRANGYTRYLQALERGETISNQMLREAFDAVNSRFVKAAREAGHNIAEVHHWNYSIGHFPTQIVDPSHLVPVPSRLVHEAIHTATTSNPSTLIGIWGGPIAPQHQMPVPIWTTPLPPR